MIGGWKNSKDNLWSSLSNCNYFLDTTYRKTYKVEIYLEDMKNKLISLLAVPLVAGIVGCAAPIIKENKIQKTPIIPENARIMYAQSDYRQFCDCYEMEKDISLANFYLKELEETEKKERKEDTGDLASRLNLEITLGLQESIIQRMEKILETEINCGCFGITL